MAKRCEICGKGPVAGKTISHSNKHNPRMFRPNIQKVRVRMEDGTIKTMKVCAKCLKAGKVQRVTAA
ncbi:50S ribosomal protein L28 [Pseudothermotoga thermarum]|uniref:Large ribosomal subunit protein bL28 n=1 Tax=Pseudothermotoga thermarum DSM 5069 TaxID=688269 RepID=F7YVC7_9THEM|nr:50S ribosomal protein L28 [Pseudothermotoga thermarum]AEH50430.1 LSU ribosomal protein L28P [Pseudothermotoga thermarum DSM 5069]